MLVSKMSETNKDIVGNYFYQILLITVPHEIETPVENSWGIRKSPFHSKHEKYVRRYVSEASNTRVFTQCVTGFGQKMNISFAKLGEEMYEVNLMHKKYPKHAMNVEKGLQTKYSVECSY